MTDEVDRIQEREQIPTEAAINAARAKAALIEPGTPGDCDMCGEWSSRLIRGACARCRDKYKILCSDEKE